MTTTIIISSALSVLACYAIYLGWATQNRRLSYVGWAGVLLSIVTWCLALGVEFGVLIGLSLPAIAVWIGIARHAKSEKVKSVIIKPQHIWRWQGKTVVQQVWHILFVLLIQLFAFSVIVVAAMYQLPVSEPKKMATGAILLPLIWGGFAYWYTMSDRKVWHVVALVASAAIAGLYLFGVTHG